ncbi:hypothetical protein [Primorskyibacter sp. S87]|uniref:hypothetical protein n=1 Tax=Primorskyibacter sp. S87 TaxID=3415126 RepID=UPI003C79ED4A
MTCSPTANQGTFPLPDIPKGILALVRLLARDAARKDFADRRATQNGGAANA